MEPKHFNMLAIAAVVSLVAAGIVHSANNDWSTEKVSGQKLFPDLGRSAKQVGSVAVQKGKAKLTFEKRDKDWVIKERSGYPIQVDKMRQLLVGLETAELVEPKTKVPERYKLLELDDPAKEGALSTLVSLRDTGGKKIAEIVLGKRKVAAFGVGRAGTYVRQPGVAQSWLANANVRAPTSVSDWVDPVFFKIDAKAIKSLSITAPKAQTYVMVLDDKKKGAFKFPGIPDGHKLKSGASATAMTKAIGTLELLDVRKLDKQPNGDGVTAGTLETVDGMKVDFRLRSEKSDRWISVNVLADGKKKADAEKIRKATKGWEFKIADWRARQTFKEPKDLFEVVKAKPPAPKVTPAPQPVPGLAPGGQSVKPPAAPGGQSPDPATGPGAAPKQ